MASHPHPKDSSVSQQSTPINFPDIPQYARDHAPIFRLHPDDQYRPTDLSTFLSHVRPQIDFTDVDPKPNLTLENLDACNAYGTKGGEDVFLTSYDDVTTNPPWLDGLKTADSDGSAGSDRTGAVIIVEKGRHVVDVFYFVFWAFNYGGVVVGKNLGNHVGDWEHVMIRFKRGVPKAVWLSQHANGEAFTFAALEKDTSGKRPIVYIAKGSHAIYARPGTVDHTLPNLNTTLPLLLVDHCAPGPIHDPLPTSHAYSHTPSLPSSPPAANSAFTPLTPSSPPPTWLFFAGHWGDAAYPSSDARQDSLLGFVRYGDGPTGPANKQLARREVWPENRYAAGQVLRRSLDGRTGVRDWVRRWWKLCWGKKGRGAV